MSLVAIPRLDRDQVQHFAARYDLTYDDPVSKLVADVKQSGYLTKPELAIVGEWKTARIRSRLATNSEELVQDATRMALAATSPSVALHVPQVLFGVGMPVASTLLHWFHRDPFPIIDFRALWSLQIEPPSSYTLAFWEEYVACTRSLAITWQVDMRTLDRALWQFSADNQPPSS